MIKVCWEGCSLIHPPSCPKPLPILHQDLQELVTSSGTTTDFETYEFDYFTDYITIGAVFTSEGQTLDIAEVLASLTRFGVKHFLPLTRSRAAWLMGTQFVPT